MEYLCLSSILASFLFLNTINVAFSNFMQSDIEYDGHLSIKLMHALDNVQEPIYTERGVITIQSIRSGSVSVSQNPIIPDDIYKLKRLKENNGFYRLRSIVTTADGRKSSFLTFVRGCSLCESRLSDTLTVSLDYSGNAVAVSMTTTPASCNGNLVNDRDLSHFNTTVFVRHMEQGPAPDTSAFIQKLEKEREARERGEVKDNRSFFAKYWMYIVPVVIFVVLSSATNPEAGAGGGR